MRAFRAALLAAGVSGLTWLAACETILALDENLREADGGTVVQTDGSIPDGGALDATLDGGQPGADAGPSDAGDAAAVPRPWALDTSFHGGGALRLNLSQAYAAGDGTLELLPLEGGSVLVVGVGTFISGQQTLLTVTLSSDGGASSASPYRLVDAGPCNLLGAFATASSTLAVLEDKNQKILLYDISATALSEQTPATIADAGAQIARLVGMTNAGALVGPEEQATPSAGEATVTTSTVTVQSVEVGGNITFLAESPGATWFGGYVNQPPAQHAVLVPRNGPVEAFANEGASGVTDFVQTDAGLFAVGYSADTFAVWTAAADAGVPRTIEVPDDLDFATGPTFTTGYPYSFIRTTLSPDQKIIASGTFGSAYLVTFDERGQPTDLLVQPDGGSASLLDVSGALVDAGTYGSLKEWSSGAVLSTGDDVYATFGSGGEFPQWFVVRLKRAVAP